MSEVSDRTGAEARGLIAQLSDFRTRAAARTRLVALGKAAAPELRQALESRLEGVAWSAANILADMGADEAIDALIQALSNQRAGDAAHEALVRITGRDFGDDAEAWTQWRKLGEEGGKAVGDEELAKSLAGDKAAFEKTPSGYAYTIQLAGSRHQRVDLVLTFKDSDGTPLVVLYSECGPASAEPIRVGAEGEYALAVRGGGAARHELRSEVRGRRYVPSRRGDDKATDAGARGGCGARGRDGAAVDGHGQDIGNG